MNAYALRTIADLRDVSEHIARDAERKLREQTRERERKVPPDMDIMTLGMEVQL